MSQYAETITAERLKELDEMTQSAYITTQVRLDAVRDVEQEAIHLLDEALRLYKTSEGMSKANVAAVYRGELQSYADMAKDVAHLEELENEALMAFGQTKGMDYRLEQKNHHVDTNHRHLDEDDACAVINHNAYHAWNNLAEIETTVERLETWAQDTERYLESHAQP